MSDGDALQRFVVACFDALVAAFPDTIVDFFPVNSQMLGNLETELDLSPLDAADADPDIVADMNTFACLAVQYLHTFPPVGEMDRLVTVACPVRQGKMLFFCLPLCLPRKAAQRPERADRRGKAARRRCESGGGAPEGWLY